MRSELNAIISKYVEVFGYVSTTTYKKERSKLELNDHFDDYSFLDDYKTIITLAIPYPSKEVKWKGKGYGILSRYSYGIDYHIVFKEILSKITTEIEKLSINSYSSVDISHIDERYAGFLSGIGYLGHNQFLINREYGSYFYLATILIDCEITDIKQVYDDCGSCQACIEACPSSALENGFNKDLCISNVSQSKKELSLNEIEHFKTMIYGCDICQKVCPKNKGIDIHKYMEFEPSGIENISIEKLLKMSNKEFKGIYGSNACSWKGARVIKRNALCLIANQKLHGFRQQITESMAENDEVLWYNKTAQKVLDLLDGE